MKITTINNSIYFKGGLKKNLRKGEAILHEFREEYPYIKSNTLWEQRMANMELKGRPVPQECKKIISHYGDEVSQLRMFMRKPENCRKPTRHLKKEIKKRGCGNCGEINQIISNKLKQKGIKHTDVVMTVSRGPFGGVNHVFSVIDMNENAIIYNPYTWGNKAVVIDGWRNTVLSVQDALKEYESFYNTRHNDQFYSSFNFRIKQK